MTIQLDAVGIDHTAAAVMAHLMNLSPASARDVLVAVGQRLGERVRFGAPPISEQVREALEARPKRDGGHVSEILARIVDLLAQCSGDFERAQVLAAASAFHALEFEFHNRSGVRVAFAASAPD